MIKYDIVNTREDEALVKTSMAILEEHGIEQLPTLPAGFKEVVFSEKYYDLYFVSDGDHEGHFVLCLHKNEYIAHWHSAKFKY